ncbi:MAG: HNH endonuclease [Lactobacillales bacterium]|jgi:hypothetical protein|nr:HNH endonuclease [Lactobacillales bacterium]
MLYTRVAPKKVKALRKRFEKNIRKRFIRYVFRHAIFDRTFEKYKHEFTIERLIEGVLPDNYTVHHILPLAGGGTNDFSNMCIINKESHEFLHEYIIQPQTCLAESGQTWRMILPAAVEKFIYEKRAFWDISPEELSKNMVVCRKRKKFEKILHKKTCW